MIPAVPLFIMEPFGPHDRKGPRDDEPSRSWNSSHPSRGCSLDALKASGGAGLLYCFAVN